MRIQDAFRLEGKTALVTGCKRGIGKAMAVALAEAGADILGVSLSLPLSGSQVEREVVETGRNFKAYQCDFADREALYHFICQVKADFPVIDILVNNAGAILRKPAAEYPDAYWDTTIAVNQSAQFILSRDFAQEMIARGRGKIIFTASLLSFQGGITVPGYAASAFNDRDSVACLCVQSLCCACAHEYLFSAAGRVSAFYDPPCDGCCDRLLLRLHGIDYRRDYCRVFSEQ